VKQRSWIKVSPGKKFVRPHLSEKAGHGGLYLATTTTWEVQGGEMPGKKGETLFKK
jgi:hypothetical protein